MAARTLINPFVFLKRNPLDLLSYVIVPVKLRLDGVAL